LKKKKQPSKKNRKQKYSSTMEMPKIFSIRKAILCRRMVYWFQNGKKVSKTSNNKSNEAGTQTHLTIHAGG